MDTEFSKGDLFFLPLNNHIPCSTPISQLIGEITGYSCGCRSKVINICNVSLSFNPDAEFLQGIYNQCALQYLQNECVPNFYIIAISPELSKTNIAVFTYIFDIRQKDIIHKVITTICPSSFFADIFSIFQQIRRSIHLPNNENLYKLTTNTDDNLKNLFIDVGTFTGISFAQEGLYETARLFWIKLLNEYGYDQPEILVNIGQSYSDQDNFEEADEWLSIAVNKSKLDNVKLLAHYNRGLARSRMGLHAEAIDDFQNCIRIFPGFSMAYNNIGVCYINIGKHKDAQVWFQQCIDLPPNTTDAMRDEAVSKAKVNLSTT